jgi:hypothetical protein
VDFGTSNTVAALSRDADRVRTLLFDGSPTLPSAVFLDPSGTLLVGRDAAHSARSAPERYEPNPKRRIDEQLVLLGDAELPVVELIAAVLRLVAVEAGRVAGGPVADVTLTHPAAWAHTRRQTLVQAAARAGLPPVALVPEPVAAADTFLAVSGAAVPVGSSVVVYDLGAGTFDASVVRRGPDGFDVVAAEGLSQAGGLDIDAAIVGYLGAMDASRHSDAWHRLLNPSTPEERRANRLLWEDVRTAKELLSRSGHTHVHVPLVGADIPLGREQFEFLARPILDATIASTRAALNSARVAPADVAGVFLVGGGSRIPLVSTLLQQLFGHAPTATEQPELAVAEGALRMTGQVRAAQPDAAWPTAESRTGPVAGPTTETTGLPTAPLSPSTASLAAPASGAHGYGTPVSDGPTPSGPVSPVSGPPISGPPVSGSPVSGPPISGPPISGSPVSGGVAPGPAAVPRAMAGSAPSRRSRTPLVAAAAAVVLLLVFGTVFAVVTIFGKDTVDVDQVMADSDGHKITLTSFEVGSDTLRVNMSYENTSSSDWGLTCPSAEDDLQMSYLFFYGDQQKVHPTETWCSANAPGQDVSIKAGESGSSYAIFPEVPPAGEGFSLTWYNWTAENLKIDT